MDSFVESVHANRVLVRARSRVDAQLIKRLGARRELALRGRWILPWASDKELANLLSRLRDLDFSFAGGTGWSPADQFERLREGGLISGSFKKIVWLRDGESSVRRDQFPWQRFPSSGVTRILERSYLADEATLGGSNQRVWFMSLEDSARVTSPAAGVRYTGNSPSVTRAWLEGREVFGVSFPTGGQSLRRPVPGDASGYAHFLEGGQTAVRLPGEPGGFLVNPISEFLTPGGRPVPKGSVLFKVEPDGTWTPIKEY